MGYQTYSSRIQSVSGAITLNFIGGKASGNSRGLAVDGGSFKVLSSSGTITLIDDSPTGLTGNYNGLYLLPSANDAIRFGADGSNVLTSSSDIIISADKVDL